MHCVEPVIPPRMTACGHQDQTGGQARSAEPRVLFDGLLLRTRRRRGERLRLKQGGTDRSEPSLARKRSGKSNHGDGKGVVVAKRVTLNGGYSKWIMNNAMQTVWIATWQKKRWMDFRSS